MVSVMLFCVLTDVVMLLLSFFSVCFSCHVLSFGHVLKKKLLTEDQMIETKSFRWFKTGAGVAAAMWSLRHTLSYFEFIRVTK